MFRSSGVFVLLAALTAIPATAQAGSGSGQVASSLSSAVGGFPVMDDSQRNQPYTLTQETTTLRTLADGTHITTVRQEKRTRDAEGRTRTEITHNGPSPVSFHFVQIFDPIAHTWTSLDERNKVAHINHMAMPAPPSPEQQARMAELRAKAQAEHAAQPQTENTTASQSSPKTHREVETLAPRVIAGVSAEGKRISRTIPAGKEGNDRDLTFVTETWTSPELHVVLERTTDDPRTGKVTMTTSSLERGSPDPALFAIPADFKVVDQQSAGSQ